MLLSSFLASHISGFGSLLCICEVYFSDLLFVLPIFFKCKKDNYNADIQALFTSFQNIYLEVDFIALSGAMGL